jgi:serine/threonine protein kinase/dipeptidyl aminopeptidase/acylaminoacyl peptidase
MMDKNKDEEAIFKAAVKLKTPAERCAYVKDACGNDSDLLARITSLIEVHDSKNSIIDVLITESDVTLEDLPISEGPGTVIGRYKLLEKIGEGGMAVVYMAEQEKPIRRKVALKIIKLGMDTKSVIARFEAERQALAMMDHPNIAKVLDAGATETGRPYFVMELVTGVSITEYCDKNNLSTKERLALFIQVCNAVQHAHQKGIIHRDIKPTNVMVAHHDSKPVPKVIDFGIAKAINQKLTEKTLFTRYAHIIGTPAYMSPEQAELSYLGVDGRTDIYSLGILLYELLTGTTPFSEEELRKAGYLEMQRIIREEEPAKPSTKLSTLGDTLTDIAKSRNCTPDLLTKIVRGDLDWIVMKSLEKDRAHRYETAKNLATDIERHLRDEPVSAGPPSTCYRLRKFIRRNRVAVVAATLVIGATLMGATAAKLGILVSPGSSGRPQHATGMVQRHIWNVPPQSSLCGGISLDGRYVSYTDWTASNIGVRDLVTKKNWLVTKNTDSTWSTMAEASIISPEGTQIAYSGYIYDEKGVNFYDLRIIDFDGSNMRVLYSNPEIFYIDPYTWSPDGEEILAYLSDKNKSPVNESSSEMLQKSHLVLIAVADGSVRTLKTWYKSAIPRKALFSPDGNHIVFDFEQQDKPGRYDIYLISRDGRGEIPIIQHSANDRLFGWAPDGRTVIFASDRTAGRGLWTIEVLDGVSQGSAELLIDEFNGSGLGFTSDGSCYYVVDTKASNVCLARLDSTCTAFEDQPKLASSKFVGHAALGDFSHDGRFLAYRGGVRHRISSGDCVFVINDLDTGQERVLRPKPAFRPDTRIWDGPWFYPDGNSLLVLGTGQEIGYGLYKVEIETGVVTPIHVPCGKDVRSAALSPDADSIYLRTIYRISKLDVSTGRQTLLYKEQQWGPWSMDLSPDGQWLVFYPSPNSLAVMPSDGGEPKEIINGSDGEIRSPLAFVKWTPDGKYILFGKRKNELWKVNVETGEQHQIAVIDMELMDAAIHPDGQRIALTTYEAGSQLWVMENFLPERQSE